MPTTATYATGVHVSRILTEFSQRYRNIAYVADRVAPPVPVQHETDLYWIYGLEGFIRENLVVADGSPPHFANWSISTDTYRVERYAIADLVTDRARANADDPLRPELDTTEILTERLLLDREARVAQATTDTNVLPAEHVFNANLALDNPDTADVRQWLFSARTKIFQSARNLANTVVIPVAVGFQLARTALIDELRKYTDPTLVTAGGLPPSLFGLQVLEAGVGYIAGPERAVAARPFTEVWGANILVAFVNPTIVGLKTNTFALTFRKQEVLARKWRDEQRLGDVIELSLMEAVKIISPYAGYLIQNTMTL